MADAGGWAGIAKATEHLPALGMGLMGLRERAGYHEGQLGIAQERLGLREQQMQLQNTLNEQKSQIAEAKIPKDQQPFHPSTVDQAQYATMQQYGKAGTEALSSLFQKSKEVAGLNPNTTYGDAYAAVKSMYPSLRQEAIDSLSKSLQSGKLSPIEQEKAAALMDTLTYDKTGELVIDQGVFKNTAEAIKQREENSKATLLATKEEGLQGREEERIAARERIAEANHRARLAEIEAKNAGKAGKEDDKKTERERRNKISDLKQFILREEMNRAKWSKALEGGNFDKDAKPAEGETENYYNKYNKTIEQFDDNINNAKQQLIALENSDVDPSSVKIGGTQKQAAGKPDKFGYVIGEVRKGHRYIGNDKWEPVK